jgi:hypothetical protein
MGRSDDLQGFTYNVVVSKGGVAYMRATEELACHVGEKYTFVGSYVRAAILTLNIPTPTRPTAPEDIMSGSAQTVDEVEKESFKEKIRMYVKTEAAIEMAMKSLYDLIWGQCTESLRSRLRGDDAFINYSSSADSLTLLKAIRSKMTGFRNKEYLTHALQKVMRDFYGLSQGKHHSNQEYYDRLNSCILTGEECGATIGAHPGAINDNLSITANDLYNPTSAERAEAIKTATEQYLTVAFLLGSDRTQYGILIEEIKNEYLRNQNDSSMVGPYPTSAANAYDYLCNYKKDRKSSEVKIYPLELPLHNKRNRRTTLSTPKITHSLLTVEPTSHAKKCASAVVWITTHLLNKMLLKTKWQSSNSLDSPIKA